MFLDSVKARSAYFLVLLLSHFVLFFFFALYVAAFVFGLRIVFTLVFASIVAAVILAGVSFNSYKLAVSLLAFYPLFFLADLVSSAIVYLSFFRPWLAFVFAAIIVDLVFLGLKRREARLAERPR